MARQSVQGMASGRAAHVAAADEDARRGRPLRPRRPLTAAMYWARLYCGISPMHGFRYLALSRRHWFESVCWAAVLTAATALALYLVSVAWEGFLATPMLVTVETSQFPIWNTPFPAVTLCSLNKVEISAAEKLVGSWTLPANTTRSQLLSDLQLVPRLSNAPSMEQLRVDSPGLQRLQRALDLNNVSSSDLIIKVAPRCEDLLARCRFKGRVVPCAELFVALRCRDGLCCSFNYYGARGGLGDLTRPPTWTRWGAVSQSVQKDDEAQLALTSACGAAMGLQVLLRVRTAQYHSTTFASRGFKVLVHEGRDYPGGASPAWLLAPERTLFVSLAPQSMATTPRALRSSTRTRGCLARSERRLPHLRAYTYHNCATECRRNRTHALCGCVPVHYPRQENERVCTFRDVPCIAEHRDELESLRSPRDAAAGAEEDEEGLREEALPCGCQPECEHVLYEADLSEGDFSREVAVNEKEFFENMNDSADFSVLHVYFVDLIGTLYRRDLYYTWKQLLASVGGLLGLVVGFSLVAGFEVLYFFSLRVACTVLRVRRDSRRLEPSYPFVVPSRSKLRGRYHASQNVRVAPAASDLNANPAVTASSSPSERWIP